MISSLVTLAAKYCAPYITKRDLEILPINLRTKVRNYMPINREFKLFGKYNHEIFENKCVDKSFGKHEIRDCDGRLVIQYGCNKEKQLHCMFKVYHPTGHLIEKIHYEHGKRDGFCKSYDRDGHIREITKYRLGMRHGDNQLYNKTGTEFVWSVYQNDKLFKIHHSCYNCRYYVKCRHDKYCKSI